MNQKPSTPGPVPSPVEEAVVTAAFIIIGGAIAAWYVIGTVLA